MPLQLLGTDWAQAFSRQRANFVGNTGYGYGDSDLIAYSERLIVLGEATLYGLPMLRITMPVTTTVKPGGLAEPVEGNDALAITDRDGSHPAQRRAFV